MRLRKESDSIQDDEVLLIAKVSDALAHPARINIYRFIMQCNRERTDVCNKDVVAAFDYSQATISQHLKKLIDSSLIQVKKVDQMCIRDRSIHPRCFRISFPARYRQFLQRLLPEFPS